MSVRECKFCDQCGKQMTVYDSDGDAVHNGLRLEGNLDITETQGNNFGVSYRGVFNSGSADICSMPCLTKRFVQLLAEMGIQL